MTIVASFAVRLTWAVVAVAVIAAVTVFVVCKTMLCTVDVLSGAVVDLLTDVNVNILTAVVTVLEFPIPEKLGKLSC